MRYIRYLILAVIGVALIAVALANRGLVSLKLLPEGLARIAGLNPSIELPLFLVIFGGVVVGVLIGFIWEWLREHKHRAEVSRKSKEVGKLEREVRKLKGEKHQGKDEVLALLD
ncbi:lipopolysaccharide assembly protein LapA domain-containing protein [Pseudooceanicola sp.]|uniref:lipopolysaccharide assembly protein LapA domain-containing protein n=1 Tax=Pseudooceanicola sp. TaxID=1914328 RepID=UPI0035C6A984